FTGHNFTRSLEFGSRFDLFLMRASLATARNIVRIWRDRIAGTIPEFGRAALEGLGPPALIALEGTRAVQAAASDHDAAPATSLGRTAAARLRWLSRSYLVSRSRMRTLAFSIRH